MVVSAPHLTIITCSFFFCLSSKFSEFMFDGHGLSVDHTFDTIRADLCDSIIFL